ncbi:hypothetical protein SUGI_0309340 [Cryptomeria japonica]|nr:hypothetical protein SUGI_0309340 [Cryptomeria japonica]
MTVLSWKDLPGRPRLTMVDRKSSRVIINIRELQKIAVESKYFKSVELVYLEEMSVEEQVQLMGMTNVLFGSMGRDSGKRDFRNKELLSQCLTILCFENLKKRMYLYFKSWNLPHYTYAFNLPNSF